MSADGICCDFGMGSWTGKKKCLCLCQYYLRVHRICV